MTNKLKLSDLKDGDIVLLGNGKEHLVKEGRLNHPFHSLPLSNYDENFELKDKEILSDFSKNYYKIVAVNGIKIINDIIVMKKIHNKPLKGGRGMKLKKTKRYVKYETKEYKSILIQDTYNESNMFGDVFRKSDKKELYKGNLHYGEVKTWQLLGTILEEADSLE